MDDILIFRLENGRDYFVTITGEYLKSCFGASIEWLVKVRTDVMFTPHRYRPPLCSAHSLADWCSQTPAPVRFATADSGSTKVKSTSSSVSPSVEFDCMFVYHGRY